jgi:hypothetical protein
LWVRPSISAGLNAEDWRDLVDAHLDAASATVTEMGSQVAKRLGDGLRRCFGYPVEQENDAGAARAALSIQRAFAENQPQEHRFWQAGAQRAQGRRMPLTSARASANRVIGGSRPRNGWYGPLIHLGIWSFLSNCDFGASSLAQSRLVGPPFIRHARCLRARGSNEHSFHDSFLFQEPIASLPNDTGKRNAHL